MSISRINFRDFLLNENKYYLGQRVGDILTAVQDLQQNSEGMGARQLVANTERIVDQVRAILHSNWSKKEEKYLLDLQKIGVALARAIDEKDDLQEILPTVASELEKVSAKMGTPIQNLGTPSDEIEGGESGKESSQTADTQGKQTQPPKPPQQQGMQSPGQQGMQPPGQQPAPQGVPIPNQQSPPQI